MTQNFKTFFTIIEVVSCDWYKLKVVLYIYDVLVFLTLLILFLGLKFTISP